MQHNEAPTKERLYGNVASLLNFAVNYNDTGIAAGVKKFTVKASVADPVLMETFVGVETVFNALTTNVLTVGTDATANQIVGAADVTEGTLGIPSTAISRIRLIANTDIYAKYTQSGTVATTGKARVYIRLTPLTQPVNPVAI